MSSPVPTCPRDKLAPVTNNGQTHDQRKNQPARQSRVDGMNEPAFPAERFAGVERLYGTGSVGRLAHAHVCVIGVGGVGSWAAEALA